MAHSNGKNTIVPNNKPTRLWIEADNDTKLYYILAAGACVFFAAGGVVKMAGYNEIAATFGLMSILWAPLALMWTIIGAVLGVVKLVNLVNAVISLIPYFWQTIGAVLGMYAFVRVVIEAGKLNMRQLASWFFYCIQCIAFLCYIPIILQAKYAHDTCQFIMIACAFIVFSAMMIERKYVPENIQLAWDGVTIVVGGAIWLFTRHIEMTNNACIMLSVLPVPLTIYCIYSVILGRHYNEQADIEAKCPWVREHRLKEEVIKAVENAKENAKLWNDFANGVLACCISVSILISGFIFVGICIKHDIGIGPIFFMSNIGAIVYAAAANND